MLFISCKHTKHWPGISHFLPKKHRYGIGSVGENCYWCITMVVVEMTDVCVCTRSRNDYNSLTSLN